MLFRRGWLLPYCGGAGLDKVTEPRDESWPFRRGLSHAPAIEMQMGHGTLETKEPKEAVSDHSPLDRVVRGHQDDPRHVYAHANNHREF